VGGIIISKCGNTIIIILFVSMVLLSLCHVEAQPATLSGTEVHAGAGICPNYYGPYEPNPIGQPEYCENMMQPGVYGINWAHGPESSWNWQQWVQLDMKENTRYVLIYDSMGGISIEESDDPGLTGYTVICGRNNGPDELVFCLEPAGNTNQNGGQDPYDALTN
jgi:hypothetical protein